MVQPIDWTLLAQNRSWLINWQHEQWNRKADGLRLHLGSGHIHLDGYTNVDPYTDESDVKEDMRFLSFKPNTAGEIVSHHALEHIPMRDVFPTLRNWYEILAPGGTLEIGMPDVELCALWFLEASEKDRWDRCIWTLYGIETDEGQFHMAGFSLGHMIRMLEDIGFRMINAFNYDGNGTPSLFVYVMKPKEVTQSLLEEDVVIGTFSNKSTYIPKLWESCNKVLPQIPFITRMHRNGINIGMSLLREDFIASGKRYWCFLDDDIQFLHKDTIKNAVETLIAGKYGAVCVYSSFDPKVLSEPYDPKKYPMVVTRPLRFATGYFILVDSLKVGDILPDMNLPYPNQSVDTSYNVAIRKAGYDIGISADYVYHVFKNTLYYKHVIDETNAYLMKKWGQFYFDWAKYDGNVIEWPIGSVGM